MSIAAAAMTIGGMIAQNKAANKVTKTRNRATVDEDARQAILRERASGVFDTMLAGQERGSQDEKREAATDKRAASVEAAVQPTNPAVPVTGSAPQIVKSTIAKAMSDAMQKGRQRGTAQGALSGYGDLSRINAVDQGRSGFEQAQLGDYSQRSSAILPMELQAANNAGAGLRNFGQLLSAGGQAAGMGASMGAGPSWSGLFGYGPGPGTGATIGKAGPFGSGPAPIRM